LGTGKEVIEASENKTRGLFIQVLKKSRVRDLKKKKGRGGGRVRLVCVGGATVGKEVRLVVRGGARGGGGGGGEECEVRGRTSNTGVFFRAGGGGTGRYGGGSKKSTVGDGRARNRTKNQKRRSETRGRVPRGRQERNLTGSKTNGVRASQK